MMDESTKRFNRIVALLIQLQSKRVITAQELAERFRVSVRTIYRDIKALEIACVPASGDAGTGYSIMEGYRLLPVMFTREEATSFVAAEKLMQQLSYGWRHKAIRHNEEKWEKVYLVRWCLFSKFFIKTKPGFTIQRRKGLFFCFLFVCSYSLMPLNLVFSGWASLFLKAQPGRFYRKRVSHNTMQEKGEYCNLIPK